MTFFLFPSVRNTSRNLSSLLVLPAIVGFSGCLIGAVPVRAERRDTAKDDAAYTLKPVKIGDSWEMAPNASGPIDQKVTSKVTLVSVDMIKGKKVAKLKTVSDVANGADTKMHTEASTLIDVETGKAINTTSKTDGNAKGSPINIEMTMKLIGSDEKNGVKEPVKVESNARKP